MFVRACVKDSTGERVARAGDGWMANPLVTTDSTAGNRNITMSAILGGAAVFTGAAGAVAYTLPAAATIIAAMPNMDIGDSYVFTLTNTAAQVATITTNTGLTVSGNVTANAATRRVVLTKTAATTMNAVCL